MTSITPHQMQYKSESKNDLDLAQVEAGLKTRWLGRCECPNELWQTIDSTNNRALELARSGVAAGVMIIAAHQSAGRGRSGNRWLSSANSGLYMSFITRPTLATARLPLVTLVSGVAAVRAIQSCLGIKVGLKWVNDLIVEGKKVGGILAEHVSDSNNPASSGLVIGIGLNLHQVKQELSPELENKIGFLDSFLTEQTEMNPNILIASLANELEIALDLMNSEIDLLLNRWRAYSITLGEEIMAQIGNNKIIGQAIDIANSGELIVKTKSGNVMLTAGNVSIRKLDGTYV